MFHLEDQPKGSAGPPPLEGLLPAAGAMVALCIMFFLLLFFI